MKTDFKNYLEKKKSQKQIDKIAKKYSGRKVVLYGAGYFATELLQNYDFSNINVEGVADIKFENDQEGDFFGYKKIDPKNLSKTDFDVLLLMNYDDEYIRDFIEDNLFEDEKINFKIETLIKMSLFDYIKKVINE